MAPIKQVKTNVMRILEQNQITYQAHSYPHEENVAVDGVSVARLTGRDEAIVFKTLVAQGSSKQHYVFVIPVACELDLKKAARAAGEKAVSLIAVKELQPLTGYVRGGCSPVGMKKQFPTFFHDTAEQLNTILVSGGKIGTQIECDPKTLRTLVHGSFADICVK